jgi:hypothetical protein
MKHEIDALATLIRRFLPAFYPDAVFIEEGCYIIHVTSADVLCVVSPDKSIRSSLPTMENKENSVITVIEIKCPYPLNRQTSVHYTLLEYYVCPCLADMAVLKTDQLLYVSYSETSTMVLKVSFSPDLWDMIWNEAVELYDVDTVPKPTKSRPNTKEIKGRIKDFVITNVQMLCELPSCKISIDRVIISVAENDCFLKCQIENKPWHDDVVTHTADSESIINSSKTVVESS